MGSYTVTLCRVVHDEVPGVAAGGRGSARRSHHVEAGARADEGGIRRAEGGDQGRGSSITRTWARCCVPCSRRRGRRQRAGEARRAVVDVEAERQRWTIKRLRLKEAGRRAGMKTGAVGEAGSRLPTGPSQCRPFTSAGIFPWRAAPPPNDPLCGRRGTVGAEP